MGRKHGFEQIIPMYAALVLLNNAWNRSIATVFGLFKILLQLATVVSIYVSIRLYHNLNFTMYIISPMIALTITVEDAVATAAMANIYENSKELRSHLKSYLIDQSHGVSIKETKFMQMRISACRPIQCKAILFYFERKTKLVVIGLMMNLTAYALLSI